MRYLPKSPAERQQMLAATRGVEISDNGHAHSVPPESQMEDRLTV